MGQERNPDGTPRLNGIHSAGTYTEGDLKEYIQRCLEPLPVSQAIVTEKVKERIEDKLTRNDDGELNTSVVDQKTSLKAKAMAA